MWTWTSWQRWPMASLEQILQRSASGHVSWPSGRALRMRSAGRGRGRPTHQPWSVLLLSLFYSCFHIYALLLCCCFRCFTWWYLSYHFCRRWKRMILCQRSGRTTLKRQCDSLAAPSVTTTFANTRCSLRHCSRAVALAASGTFFCLMGCICMNVAYSV